MSLDVYLTIEGTIKKAPRIYVREDGQNKELTIKEWNARYPDRAITSLQGDEEDNTVFSYNITHNLGKMAVEAGVYSALWRPEELGIMYAAQLIPILGTGLKKLESNPDHYRQFNPENGWGDYEGLVRFVNAYLKACEEWPEALVSVSR